MWAGTLSFDYSELLCTWSHGPEWRALMEATLQQIPDLAEPG
jgi:hypothetical protein